jgi:hypothetical protein
MLSKLFLSEKNQLWVTWGRVAKAKSKTNGNNLLPIIIKKAKFGRFAFKKRLNGKPDSRVAKAKLCHLKFQKRQNPKQMKKQMAISIKKAKFGWLAF